MIKLRRLSYFTGILLLFFTLCVHAQVKSSGPKSHQKVKTSVKAYQKAQVKSETQSKPETQNQTPQVPILKMGDSLQAQQGTISPEDLAKYRQSSLDIISFLEGTLNFLGDPKTMIREKEVIINNSFSKIFLTPKVQIEDDLDEKRQVPLNKDVQAYLKDVDFFLLRCDRRGVADIAGPD